MTRIHKHEVHCDGNPRSFEIPAFARICHVAAGFESARTVAFWFEFDDRHKADRVTRTFRVFGTGHEIPDNFRHVGTAVDYGLRLVWHLCEEIE